MVNEVLRAVVAVVSAVSIALGSSTPFLLENKANNSCQIGFHYADSAEIAEMKEISLTPVSKVWRDCSYKYIYDDYWKTVSKETVEETVETVEETTEEVQEQAEPVITHSPVVAVNGSVLDESIRDYYYNRLCELGISWWYEYGLCQMYQESGFNIYAENPNGLDKGLLQYRKTYWEYVQNHCGLSGNDIFNPYIQIYVYTQYTAERINAGYSVPWIISAHMNGGYGDVYQPYVDIIMGWYGTITYQ